MVIKQAPSRRTGFGLPDAKEETYGSLFGYAHFFGLGNLLGAARWINYTFSINRSERRRCSLTCFFLLFAGLLACPRTMSLIPCVCICFYCSSVDSPADLCKPVISFRWLPTAAGPSSSAPLTLFCRGRCGISPWFVSGCVGRQFPVTQSYLDFNKAILLTRQQCVEGPRPLCM